MQGNADGRMTPLVMALVAGLAVFATAWFGIELTRETGRIASVWIANGVLVAMILKRPAREMLGLLAIGYAANVGANLWMGDPAVLSALLSVCNTIEVVICVAVVRHVAASRDIRSPRVLFAFCATALGPAAVTSAAIASGVLWLHGADPSAVFGTWYAADALGLIAVTPALLSLRSGELRDLAHISRVWRLLAVVASTVSVLAIIFLQTSLPLLFLIFPVVLLATYMLGFAGAALAVLLTTSVGLWATVSGLGPVALMQSSLREEIFVIQLFISICALTSFAIASLLSERELLAAALDQAPDYHYVKNAESRFVSVNETVAAHWGFSSPSEMVGKSDFDLVTAERARELFDEEQAVIAGGASIDTRLEHSEVAGGEQRWFETSKVALKNATGRTLGLAGVTRDVTDRRSLEREIEQGRNQLAQVMSEMSDGLAMIDFSGRIVMCNEQYRSMFPLSGHLRVPGAHLPSILLASVELGEQPDITAETARSWISQVMENLKTGGEEEVRLFDGTWRHVRSSPGGDNTGTVTVSDITKVKDSEAELRAMTDQLRKLATIDALTGLVNRRSFDQRLEQEISRCRRGRMPISLIMVDIDRFKGFNDQYGHPAGDECIRQVAAVLATGAKRPADLVARYGGEEFCLILPETDEAGAYFLAEQLRIAVRDLALEHQGSEKRIVTISAGVASLSHDETAQSPLELTSRADEALYIAKGAGRDRVMGWSSRITERFGSVVA